MLNWTILLHVASSTAAPGQGNRVAEGFKVVSLFSAETRAFSERPDESCRHAFFFLSEDKIYS